MTSYLAIIGTNDAPLYELTLTPAEPHLHQFIAFASLDNLTHAIQPYNYCKVIDRFNEYYISAYTTHSGTRFIVLHTNPNADGLKNLFAELHELYIKALMNPFQFVNSPLASPVFDIKVRQLVKKYSA